MSAERDKQGAEPSEIDTLGIYLKDLRNITLLSREGEVALAKVMEAGKKARARIARFTDLNGNLSKLIKQAQAGLEAESILITSNVRLVVILARKFQGRGLPLRDLIQEGNKGLIRGIKKFDYRRGDRIGSYAGWWVKHEIRRAIADQKRGIRVPLHSVAKVGQILQAEETLTQRLHRKPELEEVAEEARIERKKVEFLLAATLPPVPLDKPLSDDEDAATSGDFAKDLGPTIEEELEANLLRQQALTLIARLPENEAVVFSLYCGFTDEGALSCREIGERMGFSRETARVLRNQAIGHLKEMVGENPIL